MSTKFNAIKKKKEDIYLLIYTQFLYGVKKGIIKALTALQVIILYFAFLIFIFIPWNSNFLS